MSEQSKLSSRASSKGFQLGLQPGLAWIAILGFVLFSSVFILAGAGKILNLVFPVGAFAVAILLYVRYPILYIGFTWWLLFLTPLVRRLIDYRIGFTDPSPILLSPYLVILVTLVTLWQHLPKTHRQGGLPFVLTFTGVFYGFFVGLVQASPIVVTKALLDWLTPVLFGFHLFVNWRNYPSYRQNIQRTFVWGALVLGIYGIFQYLVAPEWDRFWLIQTEMLSAGKPAPLEIRVWSTMNGPGVFAVFMMASLLLLFTNKGVLRLPASAAGYLAFLLSLVRSAWVGWIVGFFTLSAFLKANLQMRLMITILLMAVLVFPLTTIEPFSEVINTRLQTLSNVEEDGSGLERKDLFTRGINRALTNFQGDGIGTAGEFSDNGGLTILISLGWFGTIFYLSGILLLLVELFQGTEMSFDPFAATARAIACGAFIQLAFGSVILGSSGIVLWGFLGIAMAARKYHQHQRTAALNPSLPKN